MMKENEIISIIKKDKWMMEILQTAKTLHLPDWWICAGFVRSKIWDTVHKFNERTLIPDIDVIYYWPNNIDKLEEKKYEKILHSINPTIPWSVKNEARMHMNSSMPPYTSSIDAISKFPETATALGVKLDEYNNVILTAPCGIHDVVNLEVKPTPFFTENKERMQIYEERIRRKNWKSTWKELKITQNHNVY
ncbi:nucleotidyltransferase family protein [Oceanobacillus bengalensis]|uniref:Nucleotidyltransferase family protein n=1 Tax=Oceanobacillus bengalensis TaxID=1435466 RepID=A0A494Z3S2_9BACI|nr:nucleotidyltransferase family protein [Oceanobacillus bengalensis]RKQ17167.1 nucleotidyltransferase family protein [Oceanobacillus bengalensis]